MATAAQAPATPTDPVERWLQRREAVNRANSQHSTGPRTEAGKQRSSRNALRHGLTAQTAVLPTEDPETYQRHIQQLLDEYAPATPTETQLVHAIANTAWRLNRIPFFEADLLSQNPNPQTLIQQLASLGLHGSRLSRQFQKAVDQLRDYPGSAKGAARTVQQTRNLPAPHSVLRDFRRRTSPPGAPPAHRSRRTLPPLSAQRTSLERRQLFLATSWLRFFKRTNRAPGTKADAPEPRFLRQPPQFLSGPRGAYRPATVTTATRAMIGVEQYLETVDWESPGFI